MTAFTLKMLACACMLVDHIGAVFSSDTPFFLRIVGRIAFPIFVFFIAEGCNHTKNIHKYLLRLGIFALISEIPYDLAFRLRYFLSADRVPLQNFLDYTNVFYTLFLGVLCIVMYERLQHKITPAAALAVCLPVVFLGRVLGTDYGMFGVILILAVYLAGSKNNRLLFLAGGFLYRYGFPLFQIDQAYFFNQFMLLIFSFAAVGFLFFYNGRQGRRFKWLFYWFYPLHLTILAVLAILLSYNFTGGN